MKKLIVTILVIVILGGVYYYLRTHAQVKLGILEGKTTKAYRGDLVRPITASGKIEPDTVVKIKGEASGEVVETPFNEGAMVRKDDVIVRLDPDDEQRNVDQATADYESAKIALEQAELAKKDRTEAGIALAESQVQQAKARVIRTQTEYDIKKPLTQPSSGMPMAVPTEEWSMLEATLLEYKANLAAAQAHEIQARLAAEQAELEIRTAKERLTTAQKRLEDARERLKETTVVSPIDGMVLSRQVQIGEMVQSGTTSLTGGTVLMEIADVSDIYAVVNVDEADIGEVRRRLLDVLGNMNPSLQCSDQAHCQRGRNRIIVAEELTPSLTTELERDRILGFVTERGGPTSHAAILARALGIPAVSGIKGIHGQLSCGTELLINGDTGEVIVWPSDSTIRRLRASQGVVVHTPEPVAPVSAVTVMANISRAADVHDALAMRAEGVGLYRTEFEFLAAGRMLNEAEQLECYTSVVQVFDGQPVYFRLLDIGADKTAPFFGLHREENPALGLRGSRLLLARPELLRPQARALARASAHHPIHVMYPMVVDIDQFLELRRLFNEAVADIPTGRILHGLTFEVPSACLQARELLDLADFASVGTNDLVQYLFAVDRNNEQVAHDCVPDRPILWSLLGQIAQAASETHTPLSVCGELAGDPSFLPQLMRLGIRAVSVSPRRIPDVRLAAKSPVSEEESLMQPDAERQRKSA